MCLHFWGWDGLKAGKIGPVAVMGWGWRWGWERMGWEEFVQRFIVSYPTYPSICLL